MWTPDPTIPRVVTRQLLHYLTACPAWLAARRAHALVSLATRRASCLPQTSLHFLLEHSVYISFVRVNLYLCKNTCSYIEFVCDVCVWERERKINIKVFVCMSPPLSYQWHHAWLHEKKALPRVSAYLLREVPECVRHFSNEYPGLAFKCLSAAFILRKCSGKHFKQVTILRVGE